MSQAIPIIPIELDKPRNLKFTNRAFRLIERETGKNALQGELWTTMSMSDLGVLMWAGLVHEDKNLTLDDADDLLHPGNMHQVIELVTKAWLDAMPQPAKDAAGPLAVKSGKSTGKSTGTTAG